MWHAAIAHELRTPVTILRGRLQGLAEGVFQPDESQFRSLLAQVEGLSRLIEDLRVLSLSDNARLDVRPRTDVVAEVHSVMTLVDPQFRAAGFVLELETSREEHNAHCDPTACARRCWHCWRTRGAMPARARCGLPCMTRRTRAGGHRGRGPGIDPELHTDIFTRSCAPTARARARAAAAGSAWPWSRPSPMHTVAASTARRAAPAAAASSSNCRASRRAGCLRAQVCAERGQIGIDRIHFLALVHRQLLAQLQAQRLPRRHRLRTGSGHACVRSACSSANGNP
jgi:hypothetical protein